MEVYLTIKSVLMAAAIIGAFGVFYPHAKCLVLLMKSVQGRSGALPDRMGDSVRVLFTDLLGQANVRRKLLPGLAHTLIFFGFLAVQPHSLELMEETIGKPITAERVEDILASGTALTAAAGLFCIRMLHDGLADCGSKVEVKDIVELVDSATG